MDHKQLIQKTAWTLAQADVEYRGFEPLPRPPLDADSEWYHLNIDGWSWYCYLAEQVSKVCHGLDY